MSKGIFFKKDMNVKDYKKLVKPRESDIQNECIAYLESQNYYVQRLNAGGYKMGNGFVHGVKAGTPDIMAFKQTIYGETDLIFVEVKRPGGTVTQLQKDKMKELKSYGARCMVAYSLEDLL
jgi:hypothetical protein